MRIIGSCPMGMSSSTISNLMCVCFMCIGQLYPTGAGRLKLGALRLPRVQKMSSGGF